MREGAVTHSSSVAYQQAKNGIIAEIKKAAMVFLKQCGRQCGPLHTRNDAANDQNRQKCYGARQWTAAVTTQADKQNRIDNRCRRNAEPIAYRRKIHLAEKHHGA